MILTAVDVIIRHLQRNVSFVLIDSHILILFCLHTVYIHY